MIETLTNRVLEVNIFVIEIWSAFLARITLYRRKAEIGCRYC